jgi:hypothetical protein
MEGDRIGGKYSGAAAPAARTGQKPRIGAMDYPRSTTSLSDPRTHVHFVRLSSNRVLTITALPSPGSLVAPARGQRRRGAALRKGKK